METWRSRRSRPRVQSGLFFASGQGSSASVLLGACLRGEIPRQATKKGDAALGRLTRTERRGDRGQASLVLDIEPGAGIGQRLDQPRRAQRRVNGRVSRSVCGVDVQPALDTQLDGL